MMVAAELFCGGVLGWLARCVTLALPMAGQIISFMTGLSSVISPDPLLGQSSGFMRLFSIAAPVIVLKTGLWALPVGALLGSYGLVPVGHLLPVADSAAAALGPSPMRSGSLCAFLHRSSSPASFGRSHSASLPVWSRSCRSISLRCRARSSVGLHCWRFCPRVWWKPGSKRPRAVSTSCLDCRSGGRGPDRGRYTKALAARPRGGACRHLARGPRFGWAGCCDPGDSGRGPDAWHQPVGTARGHADHWAECGSRFSPRGGLPG